MNKAMLILQIMAHCSQPVAIVSCTRPAAQ